MFPGEGWSLKEYPTKNITQKNPTSEGPSFILLQLVQTGGRNRLSREEKNIKN